jgi:hypothetical protein
VKAISRQLEEGNLYGNDKKVALLYLHMHTTASKTGGGGKAELRPGRVFAFAAAFPVCGQPDSGPTLPSNSTNTFIYGTVTATLLPLLVPSVGQNNGTKAETPKCQVYS